MMAIVKTNTSRGSPLLTSPRRRGLSHSDGTVPGRFEAHLAKDPFAPALEIYRANGRSRKWTRAAIDHHAIRIGSLCAAYGLGAEARVAINLDDPLKSMAAAYYVLGTGRVLTLPDAAELVIDGTLVSQPYGVDPEYVMRVLVCEDDPAVCVGELVDQAGLARLVEDRLPTGLGPAIDQVLATLWHGDPTRNLRGRHR